MLEDSVVGTKEGRDLVQEQLVVGVQGHPPVQHLPADAQLWVAALEELEGEQRHHVRAGGKEQRQLCSAATRPQTPTLCFWGPCCAATPSAALCSSSTACRWRNLLLMMVRSGSGAIGIQRDVCLAWGLTCPMPAESQVREPWRQEVLTEFSRFICTSF